MKPKTYSKKEIKCNLTYLIRLHCKILIFIVKFGLCHAKRSPQGTLCLFYLVSFSVFVEAWKCDTWQMTNDNVCGCLGWFWNDILSNWTCLASFCKKNLRKNDGMVRSHWLMKSARNSTLITWLGNQVLAVDGDGFQLIHPTTLNVAPFSF